MASHCRQNLLRTMSRSEADYGNWKYDWCGQKGGNERTILSKLIQTKGIMIKLPERLRSSFLIDLFRKIVSNNVLHIFR